MARITKKYMLEDYPRLERKVGLLDLYQFDVENGREPDATEIEFNVRVKLYRSQSASGGYVVIYWIPDIGQTGNNSTMYLDDARSIHPTDGNLYLRIALERITAERNRLCRQAAESGQITEEGRA